MALAGVLVGTYTERTYDPRPWVERAATFHKTSHVPLNCDRPGRWDFEPDYAEWIDSDTGYASMAKRGPSGAWFGYVRVLPTHPYYKASHEIVRDEPWVTVHGGISVSGSLLGPDGWCFGFDCCHAFDVQPALPVMEAVAVGPFAMVYRDLEYVSSQIQILAAQLADRS